MPLKILKYTFSLLALLQVPAIAQKTAILRLGVDVVQPLTSVIGKGRLGIEGIADYEFRKNYFIVVEPGFLKADFADTTFSYRSSGTFLRFGIEKNFLNNPKFKGNEIITIGIRYGISAMSNAASDILIPASYWHPVESAYNMPATAFIDHWVEVKAGIKVEVLKNLFLGWSLSGKLMLFENSPSSLTPYMIPGFGRGDRKTSVGFNYYLCYSIPFLKPAPFNATP